MGKKKAIKRQPPLTRMEKVEMMQTGRKPKRKKTPKKPRRRM